MSSSTTLYLRGNPLLIIFTKYLQKIDLKLSTFIEDLNNELIHTNFEEFVEKVDNGEIDLEKYRYVYGYYLKIKEEFIKKKIKKKV
jgi:hypothetical protein